ncbi:LysR family transcriptional regulator [Pseudescherichia vulneris]
MKYFMTTMDELNITRAAEKLYITRSPLGKVLAEMERKLGGKLFLRKYNQLEPTPLALELYDRIKPAYDMITSVEREFSKELSGLDLIFDSSYPQYLYNYIISVLTAEGIMFQHKRVFVSAEDFVQETSKKNTAIFAFRELPPIAGVTKIVLDNSYFKILVSEDFEYERRTEPKYMASHPVLINRSNELESFKKHLSFSIKEVLPLVYYEECDMDISAMMLSAMNNRSIIILPTKIAEIYNLSRMKSFIINKLPVSKSVYHNLSEVRRSELSKIIKIVNNSV